MQQFHLRSPGYEQFYELLLVYLAIPIGVHFLEHALNLLFRLFEIGQKLYYFFITYAAAVVGVEVGEGFLEMLSSQYFLGAKTCYQKLGILNESALVGINHPHQILQPLLRYMFLSL